MTNETIICRCEDVTLAEVEELIDKGIATPDEIKRIKRCGMGHCQGRTCLSQIIKLVARKTGKKVSEVAPTTFRPPSKPVKLKVLAAAAAAEGSKDA